MRRRRAQADAGLPFEAQTDGRTTHGGGVPLEEHLARLYRTRSVFLDHVLQMDLAEFRRVRASENEDCEGTPERERRGFPAAA